MREDGAVGRRTLTPDERRRLGEMYAALRRKRGGRRLESGDLHALADEFGCSLSRVYEVGREYLDAQEATRQQQSA